jgi:hypothetical protein
MHDAGFVAYTTDEKHVVFLETSTQHDMQAVLKYMLAFFDRGGLRIA